MTPSDFKEFSTLLAGIADYYGKTLQPATVQLYWNALSKLELQAVKALLNQHVKTSRFMPTIAEILEAVRVMDGRPAAEEAWSIVARSLNDEGVTIVWTQEMAEAFGVALGLQDDRIAARMAFKEAYQRLVQEARAQGKAVTWSPSLGHDAAGREGPIVAAVKDGRLTIEALKLIPFTGPMPPEIKALMADKQKAIAA